VARFYGPRCIVATILPTRHTAPLVFWDCDFRRVLLLREIYLFTKTEVYVAVRYSYSVHFLDVPNTVTAYRLLSSKLKKPYMSCHFLTSKTLCIVNFEHLIMFHVKSFLFHLLVQCRVDELCDYSCRRLSLLVCWQHLHQSPQLWHLSRQGTRRRIAWMTHQLPCGRRVCFWWQSPACRATVSHWVALPGEHVMCTVLTSDVHATSLIQHNQYAIVMSVFVRCQSYSMSAHECSEQITSHHQVSDWIRLIARQSRTESWSSNQINLFAVSHRARKNT